MTGERGTADAQRDLHGFGSRTYRFVERLGTRHWLKDHPLVEAREFTLNRAPGNCFADVERAAFFPADLVPGISHSPDKMPVRGSRVAGQQGATPPPLPGETRSPPAAMPGPLQLSRTGPGA
ncbi:catalase [Streptomyces sp. NPDC003333]